MDVRATSRRRSIVVVLGSLFLISVVTYVDRINISVTARQMMPAFGLTDQQMGHVFSAFVLGYALFQIPGGWVGDRWGARMVLTGALIWWSLFTGLTAVAAVLPLVHITGVMGSLLVIRFLLGVGEAVALPNFNRAVADWVPHDRRGLGIGIAIGGIGVGAAVTPPLAAWIMVNWGWQVVFYLCSALGLLVAAIWMYSAGNDRPGGRLLSRDNDQPRALTGCVPAAPVPWRKLAGNSTLRWLVLSYSCLGYVAYVYMSWFYLYLVNVRGFDVLRGGWFASAPFLAILIFCPLGGWVTDRLALRHGVKHGRTVVGMVGNVARRSRDRDRQRRHISPVGNRRAFPRSRMALLHRRGLLGIHDGSFDGPGRDAFRCDEHGSEHRWCCLAKPDPMARRRNGAGPWRYA